MPVALVISAPSGAGKTTLVKRLLALEPSVDFAVSVTTRPRRRMEADGRDYRFVTEDEFTGMIERGELLEWAGVFGNRYGTPKSALDSARRRGRDILLDIDVQGASSLIGRVPEAVTVFVLPPSRQVHESRLRSRSTEDEGSLRTRLGQAAAEIGRCMQFDHVVINEDLDEAVAVLQSILVAARARLSRMMPRILPILKEFGVSSRPDAEVLT